MKWLWLSLPLVVLLYAALSVSTRGQAGVIDDRGQALTFVVDVDGRQLQVIATKNKEHVVYSSFVSKLGLIKGRPSALESGFRVYKYSGSDAKFLLLAPFANFSSDQWLLTCPYEGVKEGPCHLDGYRGDYVFEVFIMNPDLAEVGRIVDAIQADWPGSAR